jgi:YHS domain-containing protein
MASIAWLRRLFMRRLAAIAILVALASPSIEAEKDPAPIEALKPFNVLIGKWNASGVPEGTLEEKQKGHWTETLQWAWQFKGNDVWIVVSFDTGKYFARGELRHEKDDNYQLKLETTDKKTLTFQGPLKNKELRLERIDDTTKETQRLVFSLLHSNRIVYRYETKAADKTFFTKVYRVGAGKDGEPFVSVGFNEKECVVSGGQGTSTVSYMGKTYYVCCSGCRDAFNDDPAKYVAAFEKKRAKQK